MRRYYIQVTLALDAETPAQVYDAVNEILRPHLPEFSDNSGLQDYYMLIPVTEVAA